MIIDRPAPGQLPGLRGLFREAFGDTEEFLDIFFTRAYSPERCRCVTDGETTAAALYWFDCGWKSKRIAYLYGVATAQSHRGQGLCRLLMEDTHRHLRRLGYDGCVLVPQDEGLFTMYGKFGYRLCGCVTERACRAGGTPAELKEVSAQEYAAARRRLLPPDSVVQEGVTLEFLSVFARLYTGPELVLAAYPHEGKLVACELLGRPENAPGILTALGYQEGTFRSPGQETPFAMYLGLDGDPAMPDYFGLALD